MDSELRKEIEHALFCFGVGRGMHEFFHQSMNLPWMKNLSCCNRCHSFVGASVGVCDDDIRTLMFVPREYSSGVALTAPTSHTRSLILGFHFGYGLPAGWKRNSCNIYHWITRGNAMIAIMIGAEYGRQLMWRVIQNTCSYPRVGSSRCFHNLLSINAREKWIRIAISICEHQKDETDMRPVGLGEWRKALDQQNLVEHLETKYRKLTGTTLRKGGVMLPDEVFGKTKIKIIRRRKRTRKMDAAVIEIA